MNDFPDWTNQIGPSLDAHRGLYPLGLEAVGMGIVANHLLPGITRATVHIRYYSFLSWVFWTFREELKRTGKQSFSISSERAWLVRVENVFRSASLLLDPGIDGLIGRNDTVELKLGKLSGSFSVVDDEASTAFKAASYSISFAALGCGKETDEGVKLTAMGVDLAKAFQSRLQSSPGASEAIRTLFSGVKEIPVRDVNTLKECMGLRPVKPSEPEHRLLVELLFRIRSDTERHVWAADDRARSRSLGMLLEVAHRYKGPANIDVSDLCHHIFASRRFSNGNLFSVPTEFESDLRIWERYQERQYLKLGLYGFWHEINQLLQRQPSKTASTFEIIGEMSRLAEDSNVIRQWLGKNPLKLSVKVAQARAGKHAESAYKEPGLGALSLAKTIFDIEDPKERAGASLVLLLWITQRWQGIRDHLTRDLQNLHAEGGRDRLSLATLTHDTQMRQDQTLDEFQKWLVESCVLSQSMRVALEKLSRGDFRFFILRDGDGFRLVRSNERASYLAYDTSRLGSAFSLLEDLYLIDRKNGLRLTSTGNATLQSVRTYHTHQQMRQTTPAADN